MTKAVEALAKQYERAWFMFRDVVEKCPEDEWRKGEPNQLVPARWALHAVECVDFYLSPTPEGFSWPARFGADWEGATAEDLPTREQVLEYARDMEAATARFLRETSEDALFGENPFPWTGDTPFERMVYVLRHTHAHTGDINCILRHRGLESGEWA